MQRHSLYTQSHSYSPKNTSHVQKKAVGILKWNMSWLIKIIYCQHNMLSESYVGQSSQFGHHTSKCNHALFNPRFMFIEVYWIKQSSIHSHSWQKALWRIACGRHNPIWRAGNTSSYNMLYNLLLTAAPLLRQQRCNYTCQLADELYSYYFLYGKYCERKITLCSVFSGNIYFKVPKPK